MKRLAVLLILAMLLGGCARKESAYRVVTGVEVEYRQESDTIRRMYHKPGSMQSILTYLRILQPYGPVTPEGEQDSSCQIILHYSTGPDSVYIQQGQYLQKDGGDWEQVDTSRASLLYPLLLLLPSDSEL